MKRILALSVVPLLLALPALAQHPDHHAAKTAPVTLTGEVLDMNCYMMHPASATGPEHVKCARACMAKGMAAGFKATDGTVYLLLGAEHESPNAKVADFVGKTSTITGNVYDHDGIKAFEMISIAAANAKAATEKPASQAIYTCAMHPEVRMTEPGTCPKCGMTLELEKKTK
ncbi:MAG TPA: heavy metal-binding domain-containing protein [Candidatus Krumholzibacteria bacterium]|nr:heavy metal-binding domain-containing protein [Candidatus Krumholzibacteria bacterium]